MFFFILNHLNVVPYLGEDIHREDRLTPNTKLW